MAVPARQVCVDPLRASRPEAGAEAEAGAGTGTGTGTETGWAGESAPRS